MKPRLPSVSLTTEDYDIFTYGARSRLTHEFAQLAHRLDRISETQDRRDGDLLFIAQAFKLGCEFQGRRVRLYPVVVVPGPVIPLWDALQQASFFP